MAKKNKVILAGLVVEKDSKNKEIKVKIRKNEKRFIYPRVILPDDDFNKVNLKNFIYLEGTLVTKDDKVSFSCPKCKTPFAEKVLSAKVNATKIGIIPEVGIIDTFINSVILLGVVCKDPEYREEEKNGEKQKIMKLQMAVNRREPKKTDYPIVYSFGRQAEEDEKRLQKGSQILVDGILNTKYYEKEYQCNVCGHNFTRSVDETEVHALSVEYLNHCIFDD